MTNAPNTPDREEHVEVVRSTDAQNQGIPNTGIYEGVEYEQRRVVRSPGHDLRVTLSRITQLIWLLFGFLEALIGLRIILKLIGANPASFFTQLVYSITDLFLWPFAGITPSPAVGQFQLEIPAIIGMLVYALMAWGITKLIWVLFYHPDTTAVSTYREERR